MIVQEGFLYRSLNPRFISSKVYGSKPNLPYTLRLLHKLNNSKFGCSVDSYNGVVSFEGEKKFQTVIGLEVHAQLDISTKLFSRTKVGNTMSDSRPNASVHPFDVGVPGFLPCLSLDAVRSALLAAGAMRCHIPLVSRFERKHYFYADSPLGYQITQQRWPIARDGVLTCRITEKTKTRNPRASNDGQFELKIERIQLEQDTGKTLSGVKNPITQQKDSLVDFNRAGRALIEIVSYPDLRSSMEAAIAVETLRNLLKYIGACDGKMEEGSLRCDLNVSIAPIGCEDGQILNGNSLDDNILSRAGHRVEVKNLNSIRQVQLAAEYEAIRQAESILVYNTPTDQETRTFDIKRNKTVTIRNKEDSKDYRFMPEPDLPPLVLNEDTLGGVDVMKFLEENLPELPENSRRRLIQNYGLSNYQANVLISDPPAIAFFYESVSEANRQIALKEQLNFDDREKRKVADSCANLLSNELFSLIREFETKRLIEEGLLEVSAGSGGLSQTSSIRHSRVTGRQLGEIIALLIDGSISNTMAKRLLRALYDKSMKASKTIAISPRKLAKDLGYQIVTDVNELSELCRWSIHDSPDEIERYKKGRKFAKKIEKFLFGKAMSKSNRNAHPERLQEVLKEVLQQEI